MTDPFIQADLDLAAFLAVTAVQARRATGGAFIRRNEFIPTIRATEISEYDHETEQKLATINERRTA